MGVVYDAGPLIAAERNDREVWALHAGYLAQQIRPSVPAVVLAQVWRGGMGQASLARMLAGCDVEPLDELDARRAGALLSVAGTSDIVDAMVAERAARRDDVVVTSDPDDLRHLAESARSSIRIVAV